MKTWKWFGVSVLCLGLVSEMKAQETVQEPNEEAAYEASIQRRVNETIQEMQLNDPAKEQQVREQFLQTYRDLRAWHKAHYDHYKQVKAEFEKLDKQLRSIPQNFIKQMRSILTPEQVEMIQERMVGGRYRHNVGGLNAEYPDLPEGVRSYAMDMWAEARDIAMALPEGKDKTQVFERYKGKVNNYIASKGIKGKSWYEKQVKKQAAATTRPADESPKQD
ncbi:MAG: hypothetical protein KatS3mg104_0189 [Phycisphaerae bacterium]|jgi:hypothetical protein|nr:MAG: hypothetical protein KatS3mg104_0189 [Phycisphaerae bacterium]